jgi:hypothetical protein
LGFDAAGGVKAISNPDNRSSRRWTEGRILLAIIFVLAGAVIAANLFYVAQSKNIRVLDGAPGELLFVSAFTGFTDEWDLYSGQQSAAVSDEQLELRVTSPQTATWSAARQRYRDFDMSVSALAQAGPIDNAFGVIFHALDAADGVCDLPAVILCGIGDLIPIAGAALRQIFEAAESGGHFAFLISSDGYYSLWQTEGNRTKLLSAWIASPLIKQGLGMVNTIRVIARDASYHFYINGALAQLCISNDPTATSTFVGGQCIDGTMRDSYRDEPGMSGRLGLIAQSTATGGGGLVIRFDNVLVFSPADTADEDVNV